MVDLHVHSDKSDGSCPPAELVDKALEIGLTAIALTDHDTTDGLAPILTCSAGKPIEIVPGIELSTEYEGKDVHIVGLFIDEQQPDFQAHLRVFVASRDERNRKMCRNLREAGVDITYEALLAEYPGSVITRAHYGKYLVKNGTCACVADAFETYLGDHTPYFVPREKVTPAQAVELILKARGLPVLAHPTLYHLDDERLNLLVSRLKDVGLVGIEALYSTYTQEEENQIRLLALKYDLLPSGGSDFHGSAKPKLQLGTGYGNLRVPDRIYAALKERHRQLF